MKQASLLPFIAGILCLFLASCSDDNEMPENYLFDRIEFFEEEGDGTRLFQNELPPMITSNETESTVTATETIAPKTRVVWESDDPQAFNIAGCDSLPVHYQGDTIYYTKGYSEYPGTFCIKESTTVPPHYQLIYKLTVHYEETRSTYVLTLKDEFSEKEKQIRGTLTYTKALYTESYIDMLLLESESE